MPKIKYLGTAHVRRVDKGTDFGGRLAEPLTADIVWDLDHHHLVDTDDLGLSEEAVELLLEDPNFRDVSDLKRIPSSLGEQLWRGAPKTVHDAQGDVPAVGESEARPPFTTSTNVTASSEEAEPVTPPPPRGRARP